MKISSYRYEVTKVQQEKMILDSFVRQVPEIRKLLKYYKISIFLLVALQHVKWPQDAGCWSIWVNLAQCTISRTYLGQPSLVPDLTGIFGST